MERRILYTNIWNTIVDSGEGFFVLSIGAHIDQIVKKTLKNISANNMVLDSTIILVRILEWIEHLFLEFLFYTFQIDRKMQAKIFVFRKHVCVLLLINVILKVFFHFVYWLSSRNVLVVSNMNLWIVFLSERKRFVVFLDYVFALNENKLYLFITC